MTPLNRIPRKHRRLVVIAGLTAVTAIVLYALSLGTPIGAGPSRHAYQNHLDQYIADDDENTVILLREFARAIGADEGSWYYGELRDRSIRTQRFLAMYASHADDPAVQATRDETERLVKDGTFALVERAIAAPRQHLPVEMSGGPNDAYMVFLHNEPDLGNILAAARLIGARIAIAIESGDTASVPPLLRQGFTLERSMFDPLTRFDHAPVRGVTMAMVTPILAHTAPAPFTDAQLAEIDAILTERAQLKPDAEGIVRDIRFYQDHLLDLSHTSSGTPLPGAIIDHNGVSQPWRTEDLHPITRLPSPLANIAGRFWFVGRGTIDRTLDDMTPHLEDAIAAIEHREFDQAIRAADTIAERIDRTRNPAFDSAYPPQQVRGERAFFASRLEHLRAARVHVASLRYQLAHEGSPPDTIAQLVSAGLLPSVPLDPTDGTPLTLQQSQAAVDRLLSDMTK